MFVSVCTLLFCMNYYLLLCCNMMIKWSEILQLMYNDAISNQITTTTTTTTTCCICTKTGWSKSREYYF